MAQHGGLDRLRAAERSAKEKRLGLWKNQAPAKNGQAVASNGAPIVSTTKGSSFDALVTRVWGSDQISVVAKGDPNERERRLQFASVRGPRCVELAVSDGRSDIRGTEAKQAYWANEAKECVRPAVGQLTTQVLAKETRRQDGPCTRRLR